MQGRFDVENLEGGEGRGLKLAVIEAAATHTKS